MLKAIGRIFVASLLVTACGSNSQSDATDDGRMDDAAGGAAGSGGQAGSPGQGGSAGQAASGQGGSPSSQAGAGGASSPVPSSVDPKEGKSIFETLFGFEPHFVEPPDSGMANIKRDFGAKGDGVSDDTGAFKKAIEADEPRTIFIPHGTYLVRDQLRYGEAAKKKKRVLLIGESRTKSIIKLADGSPGFDNPAKPRVFIHTRPSAQQAEQNMHHYIYHLTLEIGRNNPGAIALNYHTNNSGTVKDVSIRASDPVGHPGLVGIAFDDIWFGPGGGRYIDIDGFETGVLIGSAQNHTTLEHIVVKNCETGFLNSGYGVSARNLRTDKCATGFRAKGGLSVVVGAQFSNGSDGTAMDLGQGQALVRDLRSTGYKTAIQGATNAVPGPDVAAWTSSEARSNWPIVGQPMVLPIEESPEHQYPQTAAQWAVVPSADDIAPSLQAAIDAGKETIYIKGGQIRSTVVLRNKVKRIMGLGVRVIGFMTADAPAFRMAAGDDHPVIIELIYSAYESNAKFALEHAAPRTLVFRHGSASYRSLPSAAGARVFMESVVSYPFLFSGVNAWLRDINTEQGGDQVPNIVNSGGTLWVLGQKTEDYATKLATKDNGRTELLGGTYRQNWDSADNVGPLLDNNPLFDIDNARASLSFTTWATHAGAPPYKILVRERRGNDTKLLLSSAAPGTQPLFVGSAP